MPLIRKSSNANRPPEPRPALDVSKALGSKSADERWAAARAAASVPDSANALATAIRVETDSRVREAMFTSLARIGSPASIEGLLEFLRSDDASLRGGALDALRAVPDAIDTHLPTLLSDADVDVRLLSCELARSLPSEKATQVLADLIARETEVNVCAAAIDVLAEAGRPEALSALDACEARFNDSPFLTFAIAIAKERILAQSTHRHG